jgi:hydrocephalus-inducing protein
MYRDNANQGRLQIGIFTITPAYAIILPNGHQVITIECAPENPGKFEEELCFDITDRNMEKHPNGLIYKLTAESVYPIISNCIDIFEEHTIIPNITALDPRMVKKNYYF